MKFKLCFWLLFLQLTACALQPKHNLDAFYAHRPRSIVVVPVVNESPEVPAA